MDEITLRGLQLAYIRRKRWEARLLAAELARLWSRGRQGGTAGGYQQVSMEVLMAEMGAQWE